MKKCFIYIVLAGLLWGTSGIFAPLLSPYGFTALQLATVRGGVSFLCMAVYALIWDRSLFRARPLQLLLFLCIGATVYGTASLYYLAMSMTWVSTSVVLMYTAPIYVSVCSAIFFGERFSKIKVFAVVGMLVGCCLVSGVIGGMKFDPLGLLFGILAGVSYAAYNLLTKLAMRMGYSPVSTTLYGFFFMAVIGLIISRPAGIVTGAMSAPALTIPLLIGLGVCTCVLPYFLYTLAMKGLPAGTASALGIIEPMAATIYSILFFHERPDALSYVGILLILLAVVALGAGERQGHPEETETKAVEAEEQNGSAERSCVKK